MSKKLEYDYSMDNDLMLERAQVFHDNFLLDKTEFETLFPDLADPFAANMQTAIDTADAVPSGAQVDAQIAVVTADLNAAMDLGRKAIQVLFTYADRTWESKEKTNTFGKNRYTKARNSQLKLAELLELAHEEATEANNAAALLAKGYTAAMAAELQTRHDAIHDLNKQQEQMKSQRGEKTRERIEKLNDAWGYMKSINQASKVVFADNQAKLDQYLLYPTVHNSLPKVQDFTGVLDADPALQVLLNWTEVTGASEYEIERSSVPVGDPVGEWLPLVTVPSNSYIDPIGGGDTLYYRVRAIGEGESGAWSDTVQVDS